MPHRIVDVHAHAAGMIPNIRRLFHVLGEDIERDGRGTDVGDYVRDGGGVSVFQDGEDGTEDFLLEDWIGEDEVGD